MDLYNILSINGVDINNIIKNVNINEIKQNTLKLSNTLYSCTTDTYNMNNTLTFLYNDLITANNTYSQIIYNTLTLSDSIIQNKKYITIKYPQSIQNIKIQSIQNIKINGENINGLSITSFKKLNIDCSTIQDLYLYRSDSSYNNLVKIFAYSIDNLTITRCKNINIICNTIQSFTIAENAECILNLKCDFLNRLRFTSIQICNIICNTLSYISIYECKNINITCFSILSCTFQNFGFINISARNLLKNSFYSENGIININCNEMTSNTIYCNEIINITANYESFNTISCKNVNISGHNLNRVFITGSNLNISASEISLVSLYGDIGHIYCDTFRQKYDSNEKYSLNILTLYINCDVFSSISASDVNEWHITAKSVSNFTMNSIKKLYIDCSYCKNITINTINWFSLIALDWVSSCSCKYCGVWFCNVYSLYNVTIDWFGNLLYTRRSDSGWVWTIGRQSLFTFIDYTF